MALLGVQVPVQLPDVGPLVLVLNVLQLHRGCPLGPGVPHPHPSAELSPGLQLGQTHAQRAHEALLQKRDLGNTKRVLYGLFGADYAFMKVAFI